MATGTEGLGALFSALPFILQLFDLIGVALLVWFYGGIASRPLKKRPFYVRIPALLASGFVAAAASLSLASILPLPRDGIVKILEIGALVSGLLVAGLIYLGLRFLTGFKRPDPLRDIAAELVRLRGLLLKEKVLKPITEKDAKLAAEKAVGGSATKAELAGSRYLVTVQKGRHSAMVHIDALYGNVERVNYPLPVALLYDRPKLYGTLLLLLAITLAFANFQGFPSVSSQLAGLGINPQELATVGAQLQNQMAEGCLETLFALQKAGNLNSLAEVKNATLQKQFEGQAQAKMVSLRKLPDDQGLVAIMNNSKACYSATEYCGCVDLAGAS
ncbi:MAG: hypothetical protein HY519_00120 [Candidatus Aenigmarchaeota archaeon]|nr:hypothetical protein [Candidatus Aenigmarchaeota archaeon]